MFACAGRLQHRQMREQAGVLRQVTHVATLGVEPGELVVPEMHPSLAQRHEPGEQLEHQ
jgi:hypothetical protein